MQVVQVAVDSVHIAHAHFSLSAHARRARRFIDRIAHILQFHHELVGGAPHIFARSRDVLYAFGSKRVIKGIQCQRDVSQNNPLIEKLLGDLQIRT